MTALRSRIAFERQDSTRECQSVLSRWRLERSAGTWLHEDSDVYSKNQYDVQGHKGPLSDE